MNKRRYLSDQEKADLLNAFNRLPEGRTGARNEFKAKHRLTWTLMNSWKQKREVKRLLEASPKPSPKPPDPLQHPDAVEIPKLIVGAKRQFSLKQKAWLVAGYDSLPFGSDARGMFLRKYRIYFNNIRGWRNELKEEGFPLPHLKMQVTMNGAESDISVVESPGAWKAERPYGTPASQRKPERPKLEKPEKQARFESVHDAIAYMEIRREIEDRILEELKQHAGKTRDE